MVAEGTKHTNQQSRLHPVDRRTEKVAQQYLSYAPRVANAQNQSRSAQSVLRRALAKARVHAPWRRAFPHRTVRRVVQGVELLMPWSHRLPDYARLTPSYGQNLVALLELLSPQGSAQPIKVIDVGANIGDSVKQILARASARILAVEADPYYLKYLRRNVGGLPNVTISPVLLTTETSNSVAWMPYRRGGTTHFRIASTAQPTPRTEASRAEVTGSLSVDALVATYPDFADLRLVKSDTDGHDTTLIPSLAAAFRASKPVLFFEFDPRLTSAVAGLDAQEIWAKLSALGYTEVGLWGNYGEALGRCRCDEAAGRAAALLSDANRSLSYLDAAVVHAEDLEGTAALDALFTFLT